MSRPRLIALLLALVTLAVFLPVGQFRFVNFDDNEYITSNHFVTLGLTWTGVKWAFTTFHAGNWHPVTWLSHMADCQFFNLNAGAHHFVNVLIHAANTALLFVLLWRLTQKIWPSALVAALFAWHPLHVQSVAWVAERKDVLSTFFGLLALLSYAKYVQGDSRRNLWLAMGCFALSLMAKPMLVTLPFVLLLLDFWPLKRERNVENFKKLVLEKIPFLLLAAASCVVTLFAQRAGHAVVSLAQTPLDYRVGNAVLSVSWYLEKFFWPSGLCVLYLRPETIPVLQVGFALVVELSVSVLAWRWRDARPYFLMGWLWFLGALVPVIGLVQVGDQAMADRYAYFPSIGFFIALVFLGDELAARIATPRSIRFGIAGVILLACILATEYELQFWHDGESLFRRAVAINPRNDVALVDLGVALDVQGRFDEAINAYYKAEESGSRLAQVHNNLGNVLGILGRHAESLAEYRIALQLAPDNAATHAGTGRQLAALNQLDEALKEFSAATALNPDAPAPYLEAGKVLFKLGRDAEGLADFNTALRLEPENYQTLATIAHYLAANENAAVRDGKSALALGIKANDLSGHSQPMVMDILGMALAENGDFTNAVLCAQNALALADAAQMKNTEPMQARLKLYQNEHPWRESFRATNAPAKN